VSCPYRCNWRASFSHLLTFQLKIDPAGQRIRLVRDFQQVFRLRAKVQGFLSQHVDPAAHGLAVRIRVANIIGDIVIPATEY